MAWSGGAARAELLPGELPRVGAPRLGPYEYGRIRVGPHRRDIPRHSVPVPAPYPGALTPQTPALMPNSYTMTIRRDAALGAPSEIARPRDVATALAACWQPPPQQGSDPREVTVRLQFGRSGKPVGTPRLTYVNAGAAPGARDALAKSMREALSACTPLRFTPGLGAAIAGHPFAIRFIASADARDTN